MAGEPSPGAHESPLLEKFLPTPLISTVLPLLRLVFYAAKQNLVAPSTNTFTKHLSVRKRLNSYEILLFCFIAVAVGIFFFLVLWKEVVVCTCVRTGSCLFEGQLIA